MFDHVTIRASDSAASEAFYNRVLPIVGLERPASDAKYLEWGDFSVAQADSGKPVTRRLHIAFFALSRALVDEFWHAGTAAGYPDDGPLRVGFKSSAGSFSIVDDGAPSEHVHLAFAAPADATVDAFHRALTDA